MVSDEKKSSAAVYVPNGVTARARNVNESLGARATQLRFGAFRSISGRET